MSQLFLTSSVSSVAHHIVQKIDISTKNSLIYITTPAEPKEASLEDMEWQRRDRQALVDGGFCVVDYTITGKTKDQIDADISPFDYVYISGGDTFYMLKQSQQTGFIDLIRRDVLHGKKTYIGTSAGSIITAQEVPSYLLRHSSIKEIDDRRGYGFVSCIILPHWGSEDFRKKYLDERVTEAYVPDQYPLVTLTDTQYLHVQDGAVTFYDVRRDSKGSGF